MKAPRKMWITMALLGLAGAALLGMLLARYDAAAIATTVAAARWGLLAVIAFHMIPLALDVAGWRVLFPPDRRPRLRSLLWMRWLGESVSMLLPVAQVGGDIVRIRLAARRDATLPTAVATVLVDMTLSVVTQIVFTLSGLAVLLVLTGRAGGAGVIGPTIVGCAGATLSICGFYWLQRVGLFGLMGWAITRLARSFEAHGLLRHADAWDRDIRAVYARPRDILSCALWTMANWAAGACETWIALHAAGASATYAQAFVLESLGQAIRSFMFLVPGALGVQEGGYLLIGILLGIPPNTLLAAAMIRRVRELAFSVPGLVSWQWLEGRWLARRVAPSADASADAPTPS